MSFCIKCGKELPSEAMYCPACGLSVQQPAHLKRKNTAVTLAISLSWWTWLYTYKRDVWKFWLGSAVGITSAGLIFAYLFDVYVDAINILGLAASGSINETQLAGSSSGLEIWATVAGIAGFGLWVWAIADTAIKGGEWYRLYYS
jgi:hypothetical protein